MNIDEKILNTLTEEQRAKVAAAKTPEELIAIAKETGYQLSTEQLDAMSGGSWCPCNSYTSCIPELYGY